MKNVRAGVGSPTSKPKIKPLGILGRLTYPVLILMRKGSARERLRARHALTVSKAEARRLERQHARKLKAEAKIYERLLQDCWTRLGEAWLARQADVSTEGRAPRKRKVQKVQFARIKCTSERFYYQIEINKKRVWGLTRNMLPHKVTVADLTAPETLVELGFACQRVVEAVNDDPIHGAWIVVNRLEGVGGLPTFVSYEAMLEHYPVNEIEQAPLLIGAGNVRKIQICNLAQYPHVLIAGSTGGGKSNLINVFICTLMRYASPERLQFVLIDLKGMEFGLYADSPFLAKTIITDPDEALKALEDLVIEIKVRAKKMANKAKELAAWNKKFPNQAMPRIVLVIDEFAELMLASGSEVAKDTVNLISRITNLGRAVGIHTIIATQRPAVRVLPNTIKTNMPLIISTRVPLHHQSVVILGNALASLLPMIPGRVMMANGKEFSPVQVPFIRDDQVWESLSIARLHAAGLIKPQGYEFVLDMRGLCRYALQHWGGVLDPKIIWESVGPFQQDEYKWAAVVSKENLYRSFEELIRLETITLGDMKLKIDLDRKSKIVYLTVAEGEAPIVVEDDVKPIYRGIQIPAKVGALLALPERVGGEEEHPQIVFTRVETPKAAVEIVAEFWEKCMVERQGAWTITTEVYRAYQEYCRLYNVSPAHPVQFGIMLRQRRSLRIINKGVRRKAYADWKLEIIPVSQSVSQPVIESNLLEVS